MIGKTIDAYFKMVNEQGGINGRKINFITYDDGYAPPKTVEMVRKLVEEDKVLFVFQTLGTPPNTAIHKYMNAKKVPQLFVATGASKWGNPKEFPWTMGLQPDYVTEAIIYAKHILANVKDPKIGVLMQNDDYGKDYFNGFKAGLGKDADKIVQLATYEVTDPTVDSQMIQLKNSGANVFFNITTPKFAAQAIKKAAEIGWKPVHYLNNVSASVGTVMKPAGLENAPGHHHGALPQGPDRSAVGRTRRTMLEWKAFMDKYMPHGRPAPTAHNVYGYAVANLLAHRAEAVRRRPDARERHEAGGEPQGPRAADAAARHQDQHQPDRLLSDPVGAAGALQGRDLEAVRRHPVEREPRASSPRAIAAAGTIRRPRLHRKQDDRDHRQVRAHQAEAGLRAGRRGDRAQDPLRPPASRAIRSAPSRSWCGSSASTARPCARASACSSSRASSRASRAGACRWPCRTTTASPRA